MAPESTENWWTLGQIVGAVFGGIALTFLTIYQRAKKEGGNNEEVVRTGIGAAFVDRSAAQNLARIAENTDKMKDIMEDREDRWKESEVLRRLEEREALRKLDDKLGHGRKEE